MKENRSLWLALLLVLLLFCCCCSLTLLFAVIRLPGWSGLGLLGDQEATAGFSQALSVNGPLRLRADLPEGDITIRTGKAGQVALQGTKHVWGAGPADAERRLNAFQVRIVQSGNQVTITATDPGGARPRAAAR